MAPPAGNQPPVLNYAYPSSTQLNLGDSVTLYGSGSDPEFGPLTYSWSITGAPTGSTAQIVNAASPTATLTPTMAGNYFIMLTITDNHSLSASAVFAIIVIAGGGYGYGIQ